MNLHVYGLLGGPGTERRKLSVCCVELSDFLSVLTLRHEPTLNNKCILIDLCALGS